MRAVSHGHGHGSAPAPPRVRRLVAGALIPLAVLAVVAMIVLWPRHNHKAHEGLGFDQATARGTVSSVLPGACKPTETCPVATVQVTKGPGTGSEISVDAPSGLGAPTLHAGDKVVLVHEPSAPKGAQYQITDFQRGPPLLILAALFTLIVLIAGRREGLAALAGLVVCFLVLIKFILPAILAGSSPLLVAVVGSAVIMFAVLYLTHGVNVCTSVAVLGTLGALTLTGLLGLIFTAVTDFTGLASEDAGMISGLYPDVDVRGLLLAGIIIGSLGVLDDVTVTQAMTVSELSRTAPHLSRIELYRSAARVGRAHIASTVNTLVLAYAGASLPLLLLFTAGGRSTTDVLGSELVATEIVRSAVGGIGIVAAVPLTTWLAVLLLARAAPPATPTMTPRRGGGTGRRRRVTS